MTIALKDLVAKARGAHGKHMRSKPGQHQRTTLGDFHNACFALFAEIDKLATYASVQDEEAERKRLNGALCEVKAQLDTIRDAASKASDAAAKALGQA
jgi:hypothetical protein